MLSKKIAQILMCILIALLSAGILSKTIPETKFMGETIEALDQSKIQVMEFAGATMATSLAISALPDDFATPLANTFANFDKYFVFILIVLFVERLLVVEGVRLTFVYLIPATCGIFILSLLSKKRMWRQFAWKLTILCAAIILVVPLGTHFTEYVGSDYLEYVETTIEETNDGAEKVNEIMAGDDTDKSIFEKLSGAFKTAIEGVTDLLNYFKSSVKKCVNSIAIMIVTNFVLPMLVLLFFRWLLTELFGLDFHLPKGNGKEEKLLTTTQGDTPKSEDSIS